MNFQPYAISQSQLAGTFVPEQILRGRVMEILPDRNVLLQLGANQVIAKIDAVNPPLKAGKDYLFQIKQLSQPVTAQVLHRRPGDRNQIPSGESMVQSTLETFRVKDDAVNRQLVQSFFDMGEPLTREMLVASRALIGGRSAAPSDIQSIRWLINRDLPLSRTFFDMARDLMTSESAAHQLSTLQDQLLHSDKVTSSIEALKKTIAELLHPESALLPASGMKGETPSLFLLQHFFAGLGKPEVRLQPLQRFLNSMMTVKDADELLKALNINMKPSDFLKQLSVFISGSNPADTRHPAENPSYSLFVHVLKLMGFEYEHKLLKQAESGEQLDHGHSLKAGLLAVVQDKEAPVQIRKTASEMVQRITGDQIQMISSDPDVAQFSFQLPVPRHNDIEDATVYFESKRGRKGQISPDSCTIVLCLDLPHLKKTIICIRIQNRSMSLTVENSRTDLSQLLKDGQSELSQHLSAMNYQLISVSQVENLDPGLIRRASEPLVLSHYRLDVKV
ncbi:flagellar hook-length control protein FliK [Sporolactobacillus sp. THM19-2]|uniref:flagellar hook-length control protein FliK n=1 Tax=Sporolactobacillus sp. THM19-2 TaxID=2511171 RepID=UPI0010221B10|nr:flagellar hook-length control protein FliK [Sporolactobacillus sp. THM19-2]RYL92935.1 hypothetical protein EWH91_06480 [Sporolactobacillus sp. THM19-2]